MMKIITFWLHRNPRKCKTLSGRAWVKWDKWKDIYWEYISISTKKIDIIKTTIKKWSIVIDSLEIPNRIKSFIFEKYDIVWDERILKQDMKHKKEVSIYDTIKRTTSQG